MGRTRTGAGVDYELYQCQGMPGIRCRAAVVKDVAEDEVAGLVARRLVLPDASIIALSAPSRSDFAALAPERARLGADEREVEGSSMSVGSKVRLLKSLQVEREAVEGQLERCPAGTP